MDCREGKSRDWRLDYIVFCQLVSHHKNFIKTGWMAAEIYTGKVSYDTTDLVCCSNKSMAPIVKQKGF